MDNYNYTKPETGKITYRGATGYGFYLANNLLETLEKNKVPIENWPQKFPFTLKQITSQKEIDGNRKIAKKVLEAARVIWIDMRAQAAELHEDMQLHPERYRDFMPLEDRLEDHKKNWTWRHLSADIEQISGSLFITEFVEDEYARKYVYQLLSAKQLKEYILQFEHDYNNFISEVRETIRKNKEIKASIRFELICKININTQKARKAIAKAVARNN